MGKVKAEVADCHCAEAFELLTAAVVQVMGELNRREKRTSTTADMDEGLMNPEAYVRESECVIT